VLASKVHLWALAIATATSVRGCNVARGAATRRGRWILAVSAKQYQGCRRTCTHAW